jgi:hypothetical protein
MSVAKETDGSTRPAPAAYRKSGARADRSPQRLATPIDRVWVPADSPELIKVTTGRGWGSLGACARAGS